MLSVGTKTALSRTGGSSEGLQSHGAPARVSGDLRAIQLAGRERTARLPWQRGLSDLAPKARKVKAGWGKGDLLGPRGGRAGQGWKPVFKQDTPAQG